MELGFFPEGDVSRFLLTGCRGVPTNKAGHCPCWLPRDTGHPSPAQESGSGKLVRGSRVLVEAVWRRVQGLQRTAVVSSLAGGSQS